MQAMTSTWSQLLEIVEPGEGSPPSPHSALLVSSSSAAFASCPRTVYKHRPFCSDEMFIDSPQHVLAESRRVCCGLPTGWQPSAGVEHEPVSCECSKQCFVHTRDTPQARTCSTASSACARRGSSWRQAAVLSCSPLKLLPIRCAMSDPGTSLGPSLAYAFSLAEGACQSTVSILHGAPTACLPRNSA